MEAKTVTLLNKLSRKDSITGLDIWYKTILHNIPYKIQKVSNVENNVVSVGQTFVILIPFNELYMDYTAWKDNPDVGFTLSQGDYIVIDREVTDAVTANNITKLKTELAPNICEIRSIMEVKSRYGVNYQFSVTGV